MNIVRKIYQFCKKMLEKFLPEFILDLMNKYKTGIKYIISGGTAAVVNLGLLYILTDIIGLWYVFSAIVAFIISLLASFSMHKFWTFRENSLKRMKKQFIFFTSLAIFNLGINVVLLYVAVEILEVWYMLAQFFIMGGIALMNFVINKTITFKSENNSSKNILIATGIYPPDIGGPATYVTTLQEELPKHGFNVKVVTYGDYELKVKSEKLKVISRKQPKVLRYFKYFWQVFKLLSWANIVYVQGPVSEGLPTYWACKLRGRKYILKVVGDYAWEQMQVKGRDVALPRLENDKFITPDEFQSQKFDSSTERKRRIEHKVAKRAEKIIVPSQYLKKIVKQWGVNEEKINVVYNAVEFKNVEPAQKPDNEKWIISVGRLVPWKGMEILIEIIKDLNLDLKLIIIGDGPISQKLKIKSQKLKIDHRVRFLGRLSHDDVLSYLQTSDVFVLNTGYEGLPHTALEAMNAGLPVITTDVCGNPEVVKNNETGLLVEYNNKEQIKYAILELLNNQDLVSKLTRNAKSSLGKFDRQTMINNTVALLSGFPPARE